MGPPAPARPPEPTRKNPGGKTEFNFKENPLKRPLSPANPGPSSCLLMGHLCILESGRAQALESQVRRPVGKVELTQD